MTLLCSGKRFQVFKREFEEIANIDVFLESITIASACNKVMGKLSLKQDTNGLIPTGGYSGNVRFVYREEMDGRKILHDRNNANTDCLKFRTSAWMGTAPARRKCTRSLVVIFTVIPVYLSVTSLQ
jgi:hypothetical protein